MQYLQIDALCSLIDLCGQNRFQNSECVCVCVILNNQLNKIYIPLTTPVSLIHTLSFLLLPHQIYSSIILDWSFLYCHRMLAVLVYRIRDIRMNDFIILNPNTTL